MPPPAIVDADIANIDTMNELHNKIALVVVGEVETVFSRRHDVIGADGAQENSGDFELFIQFVKHSKSPHIYSIYSFESPCKKSRHFTYQYGNDSQHFKTRIYGIKLKSIAVRL